MSIMPAALRKENVANGTGEAPAEDLTTIVPVPAANVVDETLEVRLELSRISLPGPFTVTVTWLPLSVCTPAGRMSLVPARVTSAPCDAFVAHCVAPRIE